MKNSSAHFKHECHVRRLLLMCVFSVFQTGCQPSSKPAEVASDTQEFSHQKLTNEDLKGPPSLFGRMWTATECTIIVGTRMYPCELTLTIHQDNSLTMIFVEGKYSIFNSLRQFILPGATVKGNFLIDAADPTYTVGRIGSRGASYRYENGDRYYFKQVSPSELAYEYVQSETYRLEATLHLTSIRNTSLSLFN